MGVGRVWRAASAVATPCNVGVPLGRVSCRPQRISRSYALYPMRWHGAVRRRAFAPVVWPHLCWRAELAVYRPRAGSQFLLGADSLFSALNAAVAIFAVQDIVFQLQRLVSAMAKYHSSCHAVMKKADIFPIEVRALGGSGAQLDPRSVQGCSARLLH